MKAAEAQVRRQPAAPAALGRLPGDPRLARVLAGTPEPPARPHRLHARSRAAGRSRACRPRNAKSPRLPRPGAASKPRGSRPKRWSAPSTTPSPAATRASRCGSSPTGPSCGTRVSPSSRSAWARIYGFHRNFCLWSRINRGTPERPGLVLTLERGGSCRGHRLPAHRAPRRATSCSRCGGARCRWAPTTRAGWSSTPARTGFPRSPSS